MKKKRNKIPNDTIRTLFLCFIGMVTNTALEGILASYWFGFPVDCYNYPACSQTEMIETRVKKRKEKEKMDKRGVKCARNQYGNTSLCHTSFHL